MVSRFSASFSIILFFVSGLCSLANAWGRQRAVTASFRRDVVIADSCGQTAFDAAGVEVCKDPSFDKLMPVAILWVNCKYAGAGIRQLACDGFASNTIVPGGKALRACVAGLSSSAFLQVLQYTMSAFEACEQPASAHAAAALRKSVTFLIEEAQKSSKLQKGARLFLQDMVDKSANLVEAEKRLHAGSQKVYVASTAALSSSKALMMRLAAAFEESQRSSEEMRRIHEAMKRTFATVVEATLRLSGDLAVSMVRVEESNVLTTETSKGNVFEKVITLSMANGILVSVYDVLRLRRDNNVVMIPLVSLVRLASSLLCIATMLSGRSFLFVGSQAIPNFLFSTALCTGVSLWDCMQIRRACFPLCNSDLPRERSGWTATSHVVPSDCCDGADFGVEAYSFEPCESSSPGVPCTRSLSFDSSSSMASCIRSIPFTRCESTPLNKINTLSEKGSSRESTSPSKSKKKYSSSHAYVEDSHTEMGKSSLKIGNVAECLDM